MFCPHCGTQVQDGALFCPSCGTRQGAASPRGAASALPPADTRPPIYAARQPAARGWINSAAADGGFALVLAAAGYWVWAHPVPNLRAGSAVQGIEKSAPAAPAPAAAPTAGSGTAPGLPLAPKPAPAAVPAEDPEFAAAQAALDKAIAEELRLAKERK